MARARRTAALLAAVSLAVAGLAACKSSGSSTKAGTKTTAPKADIRLLVDAIITGGPATGGIAFPGGANGAKAAAAALNKTGGINGHKVVIDVCDNKDDPNGGPACARNAKSQGDLAVVGTFDIVGAPAALKILEAAKIPYVGGLPGTPQELESPVSFQFDGGVAMGGFGTISQVKSENCKKIVEFSPGGTAQALDPVIKMLYKKAKLNFTSVTANIGTADMAPIVSRALALNPDCVVAEGPGQDTAKIIAALRKGGSKVKIFTAVGSLVPPILASLGKLADGVYADNTTLLPDSSDPTVTKFRNDILSYMGQSAGVQNLNEFAQDGWSSVMLVKQALTGVKDISSQSLLDALNKMTNATPGNAHDPVDFTKTRDSKLYPRLFNTYIRYFVTKDGKYTDLDNQWHDAAEYVP